MIVNILFVIRSYTFKYFIIYVTYLSFTVTFYPVYKFGWHYLAHCFARQEANLKIKHLLLLLLLLFGKNREKLSKAYFKSNTTALCKKANQKLHALSRIFNYVDREK